MNGWSQEDMEFYYVSQGGSDFDDVVLWGDRLALLDAIHKKERPPQPSKPRIEPNQTKSKLEQTESKPKQNKAQVIVPSRPYSDDLKVRRRQVGEDLRLIARTFS